MSEFLRSNAIWFCKIGETNAELPSGSDYPMRAAIGAAYYKLTGETPKFIFSGWGGSLTEVERAVVEDRMPVYEKTFDERTVEKLLKLLRSDECYYEVANAKQSASSAINEAADWLERTLKDNEQ